MFDSAGDGGGCCRGALVGALIGAFRNSVTAIQLSCTVITTNNAKPKFSSPALPSAKGPDKGLLTTLPRKIARPSSHPKTNMSLRLQNTLSFCIAWNRSIPATTAARPKLARRMGSRKRKGWVGARYQARAATRRKSIVRAPWEGDEELLWCWPYCSCCRAARTSVGSSAMVKVLEKMDSSPVSSRWSEGGKNFGGANCGENVACLEGEGSLPTSEKSSGFVGENIRLKKF